METSWAFNGVDELLLYDSKTEKIWKGIENLDRFRKRYRNGPRDLRFERSEEPRQNMKDVKGLIEQCFNRILGLEQMEETEVLARRQFEYPKTDAEYFMRPIIKMVKIMASVPSST